MAVRPSVRGAAAEASAGAPGSAARLPLLTRLNARGLRLLQLADTAALFAAMVVIGLVRFGLDWPTYPAEHYAVGFAAATAIHLGVYYFGGLYEREPRLGTRPLLPRVALLTGVAVLLGALVALATGRLLMPRANLAVFAVVAVGLVTANRWAVRGLRSLREGPPRVLLVGAPDEVNLARDHLPGAAGTPQVVGETNEIDGLVEQAEAKGANAVLVLSAELLDALYPETLTALEARRLEVLQRVTARDTLLGLAGVREVGGMPFVALGTHTLPACRARLKRVVELLGLAVVAPVVLPVLALVAVYVRVAIGPRVLFWQQRVGKDGAVFAMCKLRTMVPDAEEGVGPMLAGEDDPRIEPGARWLRRARLDELPQLWNVLRGEMSVVGPRPERPELAAHFETLIPGYFRRHEIPPGMTGLAQINGRYDTDPEYKLGHDLQYLVNWSPLLDAQVLARTVWVVLSGRV